jgi:D-glycero-alpha-D-manno-heptose 1-phosphate guanylyltransferase
MADDLSNITTVILAGGLGTRLRPIIHDMPKVLAPIRGRPFITFLLDQAEHIGIKQVVLCTGYCANNVYEAIGQVYKSMKIEYSVEDRPLGTGGALRLALPIIKSDHALVMNGDSICQVDLLSFSHFYQKHQSRASIVLAKMSETRDYGKVMVDDQDRIVNFLEKSDDSGSGWINAGVYLISREFIELIDKNYSISLEYDIFPNWIESGLYGYKSKGRFIDIGTPENYLAAESIMDGW